MKECVLAARQGLPIDSPLLRVKLEDSLIRLPLLPHLSVETDGRAARLRHNMIHHATLG